MFLLHRCRLASAWWMSVPALSTMKAPKRPRMCSRSAGLQTSGWLMVWMRSAPASSAIRGLMRVVPSADSTPPSGSARSISASKWSRTLAVGM